MDITLIAVHPVDEIFGVENIHGGKTAKVPLLRKILKAGEGYERPDRDATVTATYTVKHSSSGATICTHASRTWTTDEDQVRRGRDTTPSQPAEVDLTLTCNIFVSSGTLVTSNP